VATLIREEEPLQLAVYDWLFEPHKLVGYEGEIRRVLI
jgi:hypothetical protein